MLLGNICSAKGVVGKSAPAITVKEWITDSPVNVEKLAHKVYVVDFWATWCKPCVKNIPHLIALNNKYRPQGVEFIALSQDRSTDKVRDMVRSKGINYHVAMDNGSADWFGVRAYPTVAVVDHLGKVVWQGLPWESGFEKAIIKAVAAGPPPLLAGVDLGAFEHFKKPLCGGKNFAKSYNNIKANIDNTQKPQNAETAKKIVDTINERISQKTLAADNIRATNPSKAYRIYTELADKYDGIEVVKPAKTAFLEMKKTLASFRN